MVEGQDFHPGPGTRGLNEVGVISETIKWSCDNYLMLTHVREAACLCLCLCAEQFDCGAQRTANCPSANTEFGDGQLV